MASKETLKMKAARAREEMRQTGRLVLRAPALVRLAECMIRLLLGALLAGAQLFGGYAPFGLGMVACAGSGLDGLCALLGACFGYLSFQGFVQGLRYVAAAILVYSVSFAFYDVRLCRKTWFMPAAAAVMDGITGFVYLSERGWTPANLIFFGTELLLCGACAYFYRIAFTPWTQKREEEDLTARQIVSLLILMGTVLITLSQVTVFGDLSVGRMAAALAVMTAAFKGGISVGATIGVGCGVGMDLAAGGLPFYSMAYALSGVLAGTFRRQGRLVCALAYVLSNAAAVLWTWESGLRISLLYEVFAASVVFMLLPQSLLRRAEAAAAGQRGAAARERAHAYIQARMEATAKAFRGLYENLHAVFSPGQSNDNDTAIIFDRAADRICKRCPLQTACWQREYVSTFNALNDALPAILERGKAEGEDFPAHFSNRCMKFRDFLTAVNEEVTALLCRRQYVSRLRENRAAVCRQYGSLADVLTQAAAELGAELTPDPAREKRLRQHLIARGLEPTAAAYYDESGHLRVELEGAGLAALRQEGAVEQLSAAVGIPLRITEQEQKGKLVLVQAEPLKAVAGAAARKKDGQTVSGDTGAWFKHDDGSLYVLLCDGMGSGPEAGRESSLAVRLLEQFLRAGVRPESALRTLNTALALRGEETGGFTTIDLLRVDLFTGQAEVYKYGAAPTYVKKGTGVSRIVGSTLPAGLTDAEGMGPDTTYLKLEEGDCVLLVTDGVAGAGSDVWVREHLASFDGVSPQELAKALIAESEAHGGATDDRTALVLKLSKR